LASAEKSEIALPRGLAGHVFDQVASKPEVMHAHGLELSRPLTIELGLPGLAAEGLVGHELDAGGGGFGNDCEHLAAHYRLEQGKIMDWLETAEARVLPNNIGVEIAHAKLFISVAPAR
jgi:hypothetical protein